MFLPAYSGRGEKHFFTRFFTTRYSVDFETITRLLYQAYRTALKGIKSKNSGKDFLPKFRRANLEVHIRIKHCI